MEEYFNKQFQILAEETKKNIANSIEEGLKKILLELEYKNSPKYLSRKEACKFLGGISLPTLDAYVKTGIIPSWRLGSSIKFIQSELESVLIKRVFNNRNK